MTQVEAPASSRGALFSGIAVRAPRASESPAAESIAEPRDISDIIEVVRNCERDHLTLAPLGSGRTLGTIRLLAVNAGVSLARMNRIIAYEPDDMTVVVEAGLSVGALNQLLAERHQRLPVDPPYPHTTSIGSLIAASKSGPLRLSEGTVRDLLIGIRFVGHGGRSVHAGGTVVKNVAGYDLMKVMTGSFGTLGIITEATFKVRPIPENYMLALGSFDDPGAAFDAAADAGNRAPLVNLEVLSSEFGEVFGRSGKVSVLAGFAGTNAETKEQRIRMSNALRAGECEIATGLKASTMYERLRDVDFLDTATVAQIAVPPAALKRSVAECGAGFRAHAGSGVAQIFTDLQETDGVAAAVTRWRTLAHAARGNLRVMRIRSELRDAVQIFDQPPAPAMALMRRLKSAFDPHNIFNPGCFVGGL